MTEIVPFDFERHEVRVVMIEGEPWWVAKDVCDVLGIRPDNAMTGLDDDEKGHCTIGTLGGDQRVSILSESGLYSLILRSRKPEARAFKRWVTHEVLPSLRRAGSYAVTELSRRELAEHWARAERELEESQLLIAEQDQRLQAQQPFMAAFYALADSESTLSVADAAKLLSNDSNIEIGQNRLFAWMRSQRWTFRREGRPHARQDKVDAGWLRQKVSRHEDDNGVVHVNVQVRVTVRGLYKLHRELGGTGPLPAEDAL